MGQQSLTDRLIDDVRQRRRPDVPLFVAVAKVFHDRCDEITPHDFAGFSAAGHAFIRDSLDAGITSVGLEDGENLPTVEAAFDVVRRVGEEWPEWPFDESKVSPEEGYSVAFIGLLAIASETLRQSEAEN